MAGTYESPAANGAVEGLPGGTTESNANRYPARIKISPTAEAFIEQLANDLILGNCELSQLPPSLTAFYTFAWSSGRATLQSEVLRLNYECDRLYAEMSRRKPVPFRDESRPSYADLERIRGNEDNADRIEADLKRRFAQVTA